MNSQNSECKTINSNYITYLLILVLISIFGLFAYNRRMDIKLLRLSKAIINNTCLQQSTSVTKYDPIISDQIVRGYHLPEEYAVMLYQILKDTHELFAKHNISYFADGGTMLGAVRHKGIIPHDDDLDIGIMEEDYGKFLSLRAEFEQLGYSFVHLGWTQIRYSKYKEDDGGPLIDVFPYKKVVTPLGIIYANYIWAEVSGKDNVFFYEEDLYPLKKYKFGEIEVYGANNPRPFLSNLYGYNWDKISYIRQPHLEGWLKKQGKTLKHPPQNNSVILNGEMFNPLTTTTKLQNRVK